MPLRLRDGVGRLDPLGECARLRLDGTAAVLDLGEVALQPLDATGEIHALLGNAREDMNAHGARHMFVHRTSTEKATISALQRGRHPYDAAGPESGQRQARRIPSNRSNADADW